MMNSASWSFSRTLMGRVIKAICILYGQEDLGGLTTPTGSRQLEVDS